MAPSVKTVEFVELVGRSLWFRAVVYLLPVVYLVQLTRVAQDPQMRGPIGWHSILWQGVRDLTVVLYLFFCQRYAANYSARRTSAETRRRDNVTLCALTFLLLVFLVPAQLDLPLLPVSIAAAIFCLTIYMVEVRKIKAFEAQQRSLAHFIEASKGRVAPP